MPKEVELTTGSHHRISIPAVLVVVMIWIAAIGVGDSTGNAAIPKKYKLILSERFRLETSDNTGGLSASSGSGSGYTRTKTSIMAQFYPHPHWEGAIKFTNEFRHYFVPETTPFRLDEVIFDQLYVNAKEVFDLQSTRD